MKTSEYEYLINRGFRIYKMDKNKIWIKNKRNCSGVRGWSIVCDYSEAMWAEIQANDKAIVDYD